MVSLLSPGCAPAIRQTFKIKTHRCVGFYSAIMQTHNRKLKRALAKLRVKYSKVTIIERRLFDEIHRAVLNPARAGGSSWH